MKKTLATISMFLLLLFSFTLVAQAKDSTPSLVCTPASVDFGTVVYGEKVPEPVTVTITNTGTKTVTIPSLQPVCTNKDTIFMRDVAYIAVVTQLEPGQSLKYDVTVAENPDAGTYCDTFSVSSASFTVSLTVEKADFKPPVIKETFKARYGDWLHSVQLPAIDCGYFAWSDCYNRSTKVGNVGTNEFLVTYYPPNLKNYKITENIPVQIEVSPGKPELPAPVAYCGQTLADVILPDGFAWCIKSPENVKLQYGTTCYLASYFPVSPNYIAVTPEIPVTVLHTPDTNVKIEFNESSHTFTCVCGKTAEEEHTFPAEDEKICTVCGYTAQDSDTSTEEPKTGFAAFIEKIKSFFVRIADIFKNLFN